MNSEQYSICDPPPCKHNTRTFRSWLIQCVDCGEIVNWEPHTEATKFVPSEDVPFVQKKKRIR